MAFVGSSVTAALLLAVMAVALLPSGARADILCVCRCCYLGDCAPLENASWPMTDCSPCTITRCREHVQSSEVKKRVARLFEVFQDDDLLTNLNVDGTSQEERDLINAHRAASFAKDRFDVCEVVALTEEVSCAQQKGVGCKVSTDITAECFDRHAPTVMVTTTAFILILGTGLVLAFTKNYIPSFYRWNKQNFDY
jgi:hypothetical protein